MQVAALYEKYRKQNLTVPQTQTAVSTWGSLDSGFGFFGFQGLGEFGFLV